MFLTALVILYLFFAFAGWIIDSTACSIGKGKFVNSGYFRELPLCPLYGFGGLVLFFLTQALSQYPWIVPILAGALALNVVEYVGGVFCVVILKEQLWDYSHYTWHLHGHIDLIHALCWLVLSAVFYVYLYPIIATYFVHLATSLALPQPLDQLIFIIFCSFALYYSARRRHVRIHHLQKKTHRTSKRPRR